MTLYIIGLGLCDDSDITIKGLEKIKICESVYLENYTSQLLTTTDQLVEKINANGIDPLRLEKTCS